MRNNFTLHIRHLYTTPEMYKDVAEEDLQKAFPNYGFKCFSFEGSGWATNTVSIVLADTMPRSIIVTAPEESLPQAVALVMEMNPSISFTKGIQGHDKDDFVYNRLSQELIIN